MAPVKKLLIAVIILLVVIIFGISGFIYFEKFSFFDALWTTITTLTTVGYMLKYPVTLSGKIHALLLMVIGVTAAAYAFGTILGIVVEGQLSNVMGRNKMRKQLEALHDHIIICGAGRVGRHVVNRLIRESVPFVVIDRNEKTVNDLLKQNIIALIGDATKDEFLINAQIDKAKGLVSALPTDAENVFVTLTCKGINPKIKVVARSDSFETEDKLLRAGADKVISPSVIGGRRMAISILKPFSVEFVETLIHNQNFEIEIEEITVSFNSELINKNLRDSQIKQKTGAMVVAIKRGHDFISNPSAETVINVSDLLIVLGTREQLDRLEILATG